MKALMSDRIKKILADPEKRKELLDGLNHLHDSKKEKANIKIGESKYELKSINAWEEKNKSK